MRLRKVTVAMTVGIAAAGLSIGLASSASATPGFDIRGSWSEVATTQGATYPQTVTYTTEDFKTGAVTGTDVGGGATFAVTGTLNGSTLTTDTVEPGYTSHAVGTIKRRGSTLTMSGTFTDSAGHPNGTFTATLTGPASAASPSTSDPKPSPCTASNSAGDLCTYNSRDGVLTFTPDVVKVGGTIVARMVSPSGVTWSWPDLGGLTAQNCARSAVTCTYLATLITGSPGDPKWIIAHIPGSSVQGSWDSAQAYEIVDSLPTTRSSPVTSGAGVTSGPAPITALPTPAQAFSSPARIAASVGISIAALLLITFPANLFNTTFEENYDVIAAWWEPRLRRFRRKPTATNADGGEAAGDEAAAARREQWSFGTVVVAGAILGGLLNPKFGANSASADNFVATLLTVLTGTVLGAAVATLYRRRKGYEVTRHLQALPAGLAIAALCVVLSRVSNFQPGYLYGVVCGVAFAGALTKNENGHLVALGHLATIGLAVLAWFLWVPVNHAAVHHPGVFPVVILDDLLASLFVGGLVGSVINLIPVRFMPGHALASWHRGAWMAVFGVATFGMTEIVLFPSLHNHAGHAPLVTIIVLFVLFGGGSLAFREYFSRRTKRLELATAPPPIPQQRPDSTDEREQATTAEPPAVH